MEEWIKRCGPSIALGFYFSLKKKKEGDAEPATLWISLGDMMLSERNQTQKDTRSDPTHRWSLEESDPQRQEVDGAVGAGRGARE